MTAHDIIIIVASIVGSSGVVAAIVALVKLRPEAGQILVTTAQSVVIVQTSVIDNLQKELARVSHEMEELREECRVREESLLSRIKELEQKS